MRDLLILFLSSTSVLATDYRSYNDQDVSHYPIDYFDDDNIFRQDIKVKPESTFIYNFEQTRRNQPPQLEMREENVGRYFRTKPTTTTPASIFSMNANSESQHVYPKTKPTNVFDEQSFNKIQTAVPPPPKFAFSRHRDHNEVQYNKPKVQTIPENRFRSRNFNNEPRLQIQTTSAAPIAQWTEPHNHNIYVPSPPPEVQPKYNKETEQISFGPSASYVSDSLTISKQQKRRNLANRGSHKFSWDDIKNEHHEIPVEIKQQPYVPQTTTLQPSTSQPTRSPHRSPPSVPTLSPWYDGFGK